MKPNLTALARPGLFVLGTLAGASLPATAGPISVPSFNFANASGQAPNVQNAVMRPSDIGVDDMVQLVRGGGGFGGHGGGGHMFMPRFGGGGHHGGWGGGGWRGGGGWHGGGGRNFRAAAWSGGGRHWNGGGWHGGGGRWHGGNNWHGGGWHGGWHGNNWHGGGWRGNNWNCWNCGWGGGWDDSWAAWSLGLGVGTALAYNNYYDSGPGYYDYGPAYYTPAYTQPGGHVQWCYNRYRSYRSSDNTFQPNNGPRRQCVSPYG